MSNHYIESQLHVEDENLSGEKEHSLLAYGTVTIDHILKCSVQVRSYTNKEGKEKLFVSFPRRKTGNPDKPYEDVVYAKDAELQKEIKQIVLNKFKFEVLKQVADPDISEVRVTKLDRDDHLKAYATVTLNDMVIRGIRLLEGPGGLFIRMPQYQDAKGEYHDQVYGISKSVQEGIRDQVVKAYEEKVLEPELEIFR